jgi:Mrp family chromosome partitioning ATPase
MSKNFELLQQIGKEHSLFYTSGAVATAVKTPDYEPAPTVEVVSPKAQSDEPAPKLPALAPAKVKTTSWIREAGRKNLSRLFGADKVTRREEMKLVQRIFPPEGSPQSQPGPRVVVFSGAERGQAASSICARTCEILANRGDGLVCAVDAAFGAPSLDRYFGLENRKGLSDCLCESGPVRDFAQNVANTKLWVMPTGWASVELTAAHLPERLAQRVAEIRNSFKYVVLHCPAYSDLPMLPHNFGADGVVLVVEAHCTRRDTVREAIEDLRLHETPILGVVLNNRTFPIPDAIYHRL